MKGGPVIGSGGEVTVLMEPRTSYLPRSRFVITDEKPSLTPFIGLVLDLDRARMTELRLRAQLADCRSDLHAAIVTLHESQALICALHVRDERQTLQLAELYKNLETMARVNQTQRDTFEKLVADLTFKIQSLEDINAELLALKPPKRRAGRKVTK